eukprot:TRINITY_DN7267_c0_g1_i1.p1 TRINITY_DN7267_c0_g1~~TRINITY_DN7267_c0_g1_i1.p1  ORF type:complete len:83 (+),score=18.69 TRINITY_DN7267_c0_g1_i1:398-646(+)
MKSRKPPPPRFPLWPEKEEREALIDEIARWLASPKLDARGWIARTYQHLNRKMVDNHEKRLLAAVNPVSGSGVSRHFLLRCF